MKSLDDITPREIVAELDKYVIGQDRAKKVIAIALRNRHRRKMLEEEMRDEIAPKNIILIGSTGVGKTEIARRISKLFRAPFIKVEATKYTEVGYVGRDVESIIRDLVSHAIHMVREEELAANLEKVSAAADKEVLELLQKDSEFKLLYGHLSAEELAGMLRAGDLDDFETEIEEKQEAPHLELGLMGAGDFDDFSSIMDNIKDVISSGIKPQGGKKRRKRKASVSDIRKIYSEMESDKILDEQKIRDIALERVQSSGIVFIDEIDKIAGRETSGQHDVSREGVQRDILPIVEGTKVSTKYGIVDTTHILFIAAGAFHVSKPSDLIPELQGRFPLRVELEDLTADDFYRILTEPENALIKQYKALLGTEGVKLSFTDKAIRRISQIAEEVNRSLENIGARRLHTILENLLEDISFTADEKKGKSVKITDAYVDERLADTVKDQDLSGYIL